jgi:hypothetical protein
LEDLKRMNFITNKSNNKPTLNDEEKSKISGLVIQGTGQRHEQHTEKQTTVDK